MHRLFALLLAAVVSTVVHTEPILEGRNYCRCPSFDRGFFPLAPSSGVVNGKLHCIYPDTSRCLYSTVRFC